MVLLSHNGAARGECTNAEDGPMSSHQVVYDAVSHVATEILCLQAVSPECANVFKIRIKQRTPSERTTETTIWGQSAASSDKGEMELSVVVPVCHTNTIMQTTKKMIDLMECCWSIIQR